MSPLSHALPFGADGGGSCARPFPPTLVAWHAVWHVSDACAPPQVNLPKNITAPISQAEILDNWDEKGARVTTTSRDFEKLIYDVMKDELADYQLKVLLKKAEWKKQLDQARKAASGASDGAVATGTGSSTDATPKPTGKRGLKRNLSELSVPEELRAPAKK